MSRLSEDLANRCKCRREREDQKCCSKRASASSMRVKPQDILIIACQKSAWHPRAVSTARHSTASASKMHDPLLRRGAKSCSTSSPPNTAEHLKRCDAAFLPCLVYPDNSQTASIWRDAHENKLAIRTYNQLELSLRVKEKKKTRVCETSRCRAPAEKEAKTFTTLLLLLQLIPAYLAQSCRLTGLL